MRNVLKMAAALVLAVVVAVPADAAEPAIPEARKRNAAPTITSDGGGKRATIRVFERTTVATDVEATDPEGDTEGAGLTYSLAGGFDQGAFTIDPDFGVLAFSTPPDFANPTDANLDNRYAVKVQVTDSGGRVDRQSLLVVVRNRQDAPVITSDGGGSAAALAVPEASTAVTDVEATDADGDAEGAGLSYALAGPDAAAFTLDAGTGVVAFASPPDFENPTDVGGTPGDNVYEVTATVTDSTGRSDSQDLSITVLDDGVTVSKLVAADGSISDLFGYSVAISGNTAVAGAIFVDGYAGAAYVFVESDGVWDAGTKLVAADAADADFFGIAVAISGDTLVVGALDDDDAGLNSGSAYVFTRSGGTWDAGTKLVAADGADFDEFGSAVAISGDTVVVGSAGDDDAGSDSGSAYVFTRSGGTWDAGTKLVAADATADDRFGSAVAISGDTVVVGSAGDDDAGSDSGSAYVFTRSSGTWDAGTKLAAPDGDADDRFGTSVAISGDTVVVGAMGDDDAGSGSGSAYVFTRSGGTWDAGTKLVAADGGFADFFGISVAISGDTAVVGAFLDDDAGVNSGSAYLFTRSGGTWDAGTKLAAPDGDATDEFGTAVAVSGGTVVVGAPFDDTTAGTHAGSAYAFGVG